MIQVRGAAALWAGPGVQPCWGSGERWRASPAFAAAAGAPHCPPSWVPLLAVWLQTCCVACYGMAFNGGFGTYSERGQ